MTAFIRFVLLCLMAGSALAQSSLPPCEGVWSPAWTNCFGTYIYPSGNKYVGEWTDGKLNGQGAFTFANGTIYVGEWKDGKRNGQGTLTFTNGNKYTGEWKDSQRNGQGIFTFANGDKYVGEHTDDKRNGQGTFAFANGDKYVGEHKDGQRNGQGTFTFAGGEKYVGEWKDGKRNGQGTFTFVNGNKYVGEYKDDKRNGQGTFTFASGNKYVGEWKDGSRSGLGIAYRADGTVLSSGQWEDEKLVQSFALDTSRFPFYAVTQTARPSSAETDRMTAEAQASRQRQQELEQRLAATAAEAETAKRRQQELEAQLVGQQQPSQVIRRNAHALVIGNGAYPGSGRLDNPVNDANAISQKLKLMGFTVTTITDANRQKLVQSMAQFRRTAAAADISLLFYAGHGVQIFGTNYILPTDVDQSDPAQATIQGVSLNSVVESFLPGKTKLVFLDACRDNPLQRTNDRSVSKGLAPISAAEGTLISYATKDGQTAADGAGTKNSPFTQALLEHLNDPQDIAVVLRKVREKVMKATGGKQQPWEYGSLTGGELVLSAIRSK